MTPLNLKKEAKKLLWLLPGPVFYALFRLSFLFPDFVETVYSRAVFRFVNQLISGATGLLPFSFSEFLLYAFVLFIAVFLVRMIVAAVRAKREWWQAVLRRIVALLGIASILYALFVALWGFNYARLPLAKTLGLDASPATVGELYQTCEALVARANTLRNSVPENEAGVFAPKATRQQIMHSIDGYYKRTASITGFDFLGGSYGPVKPVLYSSGLSWAHISGIYFPYMGEANINMDAPMLLFAASGLHEAAHQRGFAREDEANFLAYYTGIYSGDASVEYSGTMLALIHAMNALYDADRELYFDLRASYSSAIERDLADRSRYWMQYESPVSETAREVNNTFLMANMQQDGVKSYGRIVDLIIALWRSGRV